MCGGGGSHGPNPRTPDVVAVTYGLPTGTRITTNCLVAGRIEDAAGGVTSTIRPLTHPSEQAEGGLAVDATPKQCSIEGCGKSYLARGVCDMHYRRLRRSGHVPPKPPLVRRFWSKVAAGDGRSCWTWTAALNDSGYGVFNLSGRMVRAHRIAYEFSYGPIPDGMQVDHVCRNRQCVNPAHLRIATNKQNGENRSGAHRDSRSGVLGVHWDERHQRWVAQVCHNRKRWAKKFTSMEEAVEAVRAKRLEWFTYNELDKSE